MPFPSQRLRSFTVEGVREIYANQSGCYGIFNSQRCIYIGKAEDIRRRLLEHVQGQSDQSRCISSYHPTYWVGFVTLNLDVVERLLISEYNPACNLA
ncbi:MAG: GIY-YIG nuclease family protein [Aggregatilineales bacterium]